MTYEEALEIALRDYELARKEPWRADAIARTLMNRHNLPAKTEQEPWSAEAAGEVPKDEGQPPPN